MTSREANRDGVSGSFLQAKRARNSVPIGFPVGLKNFVPVIGFSQEKC